MERSEAYWILHNMWGEANEEQREALSIAQRDIEFVDLMDDRFAPVKRGRWKEKVNSIHDTHTGEYYDEGYFVCSICGYECWDSSNYCPNCGARMDGDSK